MSNNDGKTHGHVSLHCNCKLFFLLWLLLFRLHGLQFVLHGLQFLPTFGLVTGTICAAESGIRQIHSELLLHTYKIHCYLQFPCLSTPLLWSLGGYRLFLLCLKQCVFICLVSRYYFMHKAITVQAKVVNNWKKLWCHTLSLSERVLENKQE
jgi:hypothetical protein